MGYDESRARNQLEPTIILLMTLWSTLGRTLVTFNEAVIVIYTRDDNYDLLRDGLIANVRQ